ncbi:MAG: HYR domain-containing protein, partial [Bacteroidota bacterium]|nr:HYR domain-containing protein [Bacteroidota bacterium]
VPSPVIDNFCVEVFSVSYQIDADPVVSVPVVVGSPIPPISRRFTVGLHNITWTIISASGTPYTCIQKVTVTDMQLPSLTCPASKIVAADNGKSFASNVQVLPPTYSDNCPNAVLTWIMTGETTGTGTGDPSGINIVPSPNTFNVGVTTIRYTLTDVSNNPVTCSFTITVTSQPDITCLLDIVHDTDPGECNYTVNPGAPVLNDGAQPIDWTYTIGGGLPVTFVGSIGNPGPPDIGDYDFPVGITTITWTATNSSGSDQCTQTVTVADNEPPTFTTANTVSYCVENIQNAVYNPTPNLSITPEYDDLTTPRPEYYRLTATSKLLDLDPVANNFNDNCCADNLLIIHWEIIFASTPNPATAAHELVTKPAILGQTGQPSAYGDIDFPGDGVNFTDIIHQINYWLEDCNGNPASNPVIHTVNIIIKPRPNVVKVP